MYILHAKFDGKTVFNEEIPVYKWQKKIKHIKIILGKIEVTIVLYILHIGKAQGVHIANY